MPILISLILCVLFSSVPVWAIPDVGSSPVVSKVQVEGFRTARFGMTVNEVMGAIHRDFNIEESQVEREEHLTEKTESLWVLVDDLMPESGPAKVYYIFGFKSRKLIQVNITWGRSVTGGVDPGRVVATANQLRDHFIRKGFEKEGLVANAALGEGVILVFRGKDSKGRMVVLLLSNIPSKEESDNENIHLRLSYISNPENPDVFRINEDDF